MRRTARQNVWFYRESKVQLFCDAVYGKALKVFVPLTEAAVENSRLGYLHGLPMIGRGHRSFVTESEYQLGAVAAKFYRQRNSRFKGIEKAAVW